ncbi:cAMP specific 3,5 cyclic phosphodiesterase [Trypanosoma cruzi]|nr:hypothetical protein TcBrA4_0134870 [Trypanosoma cruzi]RNF15482.1 cAMP specific 3,5 cyclic phosphodiesterase [Trypanosoma cruzi]
MKATAAHVPVKRIADSRPNERLMALFIAQIRKRLAESTSLDEFNNWMNEQYQALEASLLEPQSLRPLVDAVGEAVLTPTSQETLTECGDEYIEHGVYWVPETQGNPCTTFSSTTESFHVNTPASIGKLNRASPRAANAAETNTQSLLQHEMNRLLLSPRSTGPGEDVKTEKEALSVLQLSSVWAPSIFHRGIAKPLGRGKPYRGSETNPLGCGDSHGSEIQSYSILPDSIHGASTVSHRTGAPPLRNGVSILDIGSNGDFGEGMPAFSLDGRLTNQGPIFSRSSSRHSPVFRPIDQVQEALRSVGVPFLGDVNSSNVDMLHYRQCYGPKAYVYTCLNVLLRYNFSVRFGFNVRRLYCFYNTAVNYIFPGNPFHNAYHASDIVLAAHQFLSEPHVAENFSDEELFSFLFASTVMKLGHVGMTNAFLIKIHHPYAALYGFFSPQQSVSLALGLTLLDTPECRFPTFASSQESDHDSTPSVWTHEKGVELYEMTAQLIISTDERRHQVLLNQLQQILREGAGNVVRESHLMIILQNVLHAADFCYVFRLSSVYRIAAACAVAEVYQQNQTRIWLTERGLRQWPWKGPHAATAGEKRAKESNNNILGGFFSYEGSFYGMSECREPEKVPSMYSDLTEGLTPSNPSLTPTVGHIGEASGFSPLHHAKVLQTAVLETVFLPFIFTLSPFVPDYWLTNAQSNLVWLGEFSADAFEADVMGLLRNPETGGLRLRSIGANGFERRVLRRIVDPLFQQHTEETK